MIPNYKKIYTDLLDRKYPEKKQLCESILQKAIIESLDVICLNELIFGEKQRTSQKNNQLFKSYDKDTVIKILEHQKRYGLSNVQLATHFKLSRNTVAKWKKESLFYESQ